MEMTLEAGEQKFLLHKTASKLPGVDNGFVFWLTGSLASFISQGSLNNCNTLSCPLSIPPEDSLLAGGGPWVLSACSAHRTGRFTQLRAAGCISLTDKYSEAHVAC